MEGRTVQLSRCRPATYKVESVLVHVTQYVDDVSRPEAELGLSEQQFHFKN